MGLLIFAEEPYKVIKKAFFLKCNLYLPINIWRHLEIWRQHQVQWIFFVIRYRLGRPGRWMLKVRETMGKSATMVQIWCHHGRGHKGGLRNSSISDIYSPSPIRRMQGGAVWRDLAGRGSRKGSWFLRVARFRWGWNGPKSGRWTRTWRWRRFYWGIFHCAGSTYIIRIQIQ